MYASDLTPSGQTVGQAITAASPHRNLQDDINWWLGQDFQSDPSREDWSQRRRDADGKIKTTLWDNIFGRDQTEVQAAYERYRYGELEPEIKALNAQASALGRGPLTEQEIASMTPEDFAQRGATLTQSGEVQGALLTMPGGREALTALGDNPTLQELQGAVAQTTQTIKDKDVKAQQTREDTVTESGRKFQVDVANQQLEAGQERLLAQLEFQRQDNKSRNDLQMMQMDYNNRRDDRRDRRDRRQDTLAMITAGLSNLGKAFAY